MEYKSKYHEHAFREFRACGWCDENGKFECEMQEAICNHVLALLDVFSNEGHSGSTAPYAVNLFKALAMWEPIGAITGEDWEWVEVGEGRFQNIRCSHVFKENGKAYDIDGKIFREPDGSTFTSADSHVPVEFPYTPKREYVDVERE